MKLSQNHKLALLALIVVLMTFFWRPIEDYDIWFYLVPGREIAATGKIPDTMFYLLPLLGEPASYIEWGFGLIYYWAYVIGGYTGMTALNAAFGTTTLLLAYRAAIGKRVGWSSVGMLALTGVAWWISARINYRAETALLLSMAATLYALERYSENGDKRWLLLIPVAGWLLIQLHPSVLFLLPLLGAYAAEFFFSPLAGRARGKTAFLMVVIALTTLAIACLNPYGWHQVVLPLSALFNALLSGEDMREDITEYLPVMDTEYSIDFVAMVVIGILALAFQRKRRISSVILLTLFGSLTYLYVRNIGLFALVLLGPLVRLEMSAFPGKILPHVQRFGAVVALASLLVLPFWLGKFGHGIKQGMFPEKSATYLKQYLRGGHVLNYFDYGGYLAWALGSGFLVFVDGHDTKLNRAVQWHDAIFRADKGWQNAVTQYRIDAIFTPTVMQFSGRMIPLIEQLASSSEWRLVVRESAGLLFLRADLVLGTELDKSQIWEQVVEEASRELRKYPDHPHPWAALALAYRVKGDTVEAATAERQYNIRLSQSIPSSDQK